MGKIDFRGYWLLSAILCAGLSSVFGAPYYGQILELKQPDGTVIEVTGYGDELYGRFESLDGYTLVRDCATGWMVYADTNEDASEFVPTEVTYDHRKPTDPDHPSFIARMQAKQKKTSKQMTGGGTQNRGLQKHLDLRADIIRGKKQKSRSQLQPAFDMAQETDPFEAMAPAAVQPAAENTVGLTLVVDFSDDPGTIPVSEVEALCNQVGYTGYGNNGSIRDYFYDVSGGVITYTNMVIGYVRVPHPKTYYEDGCDGYGLTQQLVKDAIEVAIAQGADFSSLSREGSNNRVLAVNLLYAGDSNCGWASGIWPHRGWVGWPNGWTASDGTVFLDYQMTAMKTSLTIGTFCHENGHLLFDYPDLYDYGGESKGAGSYCLMAHGADSKNPSTINPYFRDLAGWETMIDITDSFGEGFSHSANSLTTYRFSHPTNSQEYFLIESVVNEGRQTVMADEGLLIWHIDEAKNQYGANDEEQMTPAQHYCVSVEQADGAFHLENGVWTSNEGDLFHAGYVDRFDDTTLPNANWWDGSDSGMLLQAISAIGNPMTFVLGVPEDLQITPYTNFESAGVKGGPFYPSSKSYVLKNTGTTAVSWTAETSADWYDISAAGGTLAAGASETLLVTLNANADLLATGLHTETLLLNDVTNGITTERLVLLEIKPGQLIGYWKLDETTGTTAADMTGSGFDGTLTNTTFDAGSVTGKFGNALQFDGADDYVNIPNNDALNPANAITVSAWIKADTWQPNYWQGSIVSKDAWDAGSSGYVLRCGQNGQLSFALGIGGGWPEARSGQVMSTGTWHHVIGTYDGSTVKVYVDGSEAASAQATGSISSNTRPMNIGRGTYDNTRRFDGAVDEVRIYDYALDEVGIAALYTGGRAESPTPNDGRTDVLETAVLQWVGGASAVQHDVYIGTDEAAVTNAGRQSPEYYRGRIQDTIYYPGLTDLTTYFWRIDEVLADESIIPGVLWNFTTDFGPGGTNFFTVSYTGSRNNHTGWVGYEFTPSESFIIKALGRPISTSMLYNHNVKIWRVSDRAEVAAVTVTPSSEIDDLGYAYELLPSAVLLRSGVTYRIASWETSGGDAWRDSADISSHTAVASISQGVWGGGSDSYPANTYGGVEQGYVPATFFYGEPAAADFDGSGVVDIADLRTMCANWLQDVPAYDIAPEGGDGIINLLDFQVLAEEWSP